MAYRPSRGRGGGRAQGIVNSRNPYNVLGMDSSDGSDDSPNDPSLALANLNIKDSDDSSPRVEAPTGPTDTPTSGYRNGLTRQSVGNGHNLAFLSGPGGFRSSSRTWVSNRTQEHNEYALVRNAMKRLFPKSEVAKIKYPEYIEHRQAVVKSRKALLERKLLAKEQEHGFQFEMPYERNPNLFETNSSFVLRFPTIWCLNWSEDKEDIAPWPTLAEMKWEGDDRAKTGVGRFPPIPREVGAPGIQWNQLQAVEQYELDKTCLVPDMEDIYLPVDEIDDEVKYDLINKDLEDAINEFLEC